MRRYKFKTAEDAIELCSSLGKSTSMVVLTESTEEAMKKMSESLHWVVCSQRSCNSVHAMTFTIVELYLVCFTHKTIT